MRAISLYITNKQKDTQTKTFFNDIDYLFLLKKMPTYILVLVLF